MKLTLRDYREIITTGLDKLLLQNRGLIVFDDYDPNVDGDAIMREGLQERLAKKDFRRLREMLRVLIHSFRCFDHYGFATYLFQKTGYQLKPFPRESLQIHEIKKLYVNVSGSGEFVFTTLQIALMFGSGVIYCIKGSYPDLKARWLDPNTIEVVIPGQGEELTRVSKVTTNNEIINILYRQS